MSVKRILNAKGTAFIRLHLNAFYKGTALFDATGTVFNICLYLLFDAKICKEPIQPPRFERGTALVELRPVHEGFGNRGFPVVFAMP